MHLNDSFHTICLNILAQSSKPNLAKIKVMFTNSTAADPVTIKLEGANAAQGQSSAKSSNPLVDDKEIILRIYNETRSYKPSNEGIVRMSETCSRLRAIALPLIFRKVFNWKKGRYTGGAWPSTAWPYIRVVSVYDQPDSSRNLFYNADLLSTLPSLANVDHILLDVFYDEPDLHDILTSPFLSSINTLRHLDTLSLRQPRFDGPSLMHAIAQMHHLTSLTLALSSHVIQRLKLQEYDRYEELNNVAEILRSVAPVLMRLEISGDLVDLQMIEWTEWPRLSGLRFVGHVPYSYFRPIATVVSRMPILQSLTCDFKAEEKPRPSFIYCPPDYHLHFPLSTILPNLISFSLSNLQPGDQTVRQLPLSLESLRVVALRDTHYLTIGDLNMEPRYHYSALSDGDADLWINAASELPHLSKLTLHLKSIPSPELLHRIAQACPRLQYLELEKASFEFNDNESSDSTLVCCNII
ncbi:hypothetical protein C0992_008625 [Termitomyces sp. T32_za158]|nr:hypothetical protein C0992_008625 [Termitomyces sp. T32_za158]